MEAMENKMMQAETAAKVAKLDRLIENAQRILRTKRMGTVHQGNMLNEIEGWKRQRRALLAQAKAE